jgi:hypothetical protein
VFHVAQKTKGRRSAINCRTTRHRADAVSDGVEGKPPQRLWKKSNLRRNALCK